MVTITQKTIAMISLFRVEVCLGAGIFVLVGQILAVRQIPRLEIGLAGFLGAFALTGVAMIVNDTFDYEVDLVNAPNRALPSGAVTRREAILLAAAVSLAAISLAPLLNPASFVLGIIFWALNILYNWRLKESGLPGNLLVAASVGGTFVVGAVTVDAPWNPLIWTLAGVAFLITLGIEFAGGVMDLQGDRLRCCRTIAMKKGRTFTLRLTAAAWGAAILLGFLPVINGWLSKIYLVCILGIDLLLTIFLINIFQSPTPSAGRKVTRAAYTAAIAVVALGVAGFFIWGFVE